MSLTPPVPLAAVERALTAYRVATGRSADQRAFQRSLRALDGTIVRLHRNYEKTCLKFHNPSIDDFVRDYLFERADLVRMLIDGSVYFDQPRRLSDVLNLSDMLNSGANAAPLIDALRRTSEADPWGTPEPFWRVCTMIDITRWITRWIGWSDPFGPIMAQLAALHVTSLRSEVARLLIALDEIEDDCIDAEADRLFTEARSLLLDGPDGWDDVDDTTRFIGSFDYTSARHRLWPGNLPTELLDSWNTQIGHALKAWNEGNFEYAGNMENLLMIADKYELPIATSVEAAEVRREVEKLTGTALCAGRKRQVVEKDEDRAVARVLGALDA